jgi:hypothetical protein
MSSPSAKPSPTPSPKPSPSVSPGTDLSLYDGGFVAANGWSVDSSWGACNSSPVTKSVGGQQALFIDLSCKGYIGGGAVDWGNITANSAPSLGLNDALTFDIYSGATTSFNGLNVITQDASNNNRSVPVADFFVSKPPVANSWNAVSIPASSLLTGSPLAMIEFFNNQSGNGGTFAINHLKIHQGGTSSGPPPQPTPSGTVNFTIDAGAGSRKAISPYVYGLNGEVVDSSGVNHLPHFGLARQGGNRSSVLNWKTGLSNAGTDWYCENDNLVNPQNITGDGVWSRDSILKTYQSTNAVLTTIPMLDFVANDSWYPQNNGGGNCADVRDKDAANMARPGRPLHISSSTARTPRIPRIPMPAKRADQRRAVRPISENRFGAATLAGQEVVLRPG